LVFPFLRHILDLKIVKSKTSSKTFTPYNQILFFYGTGCPIWTFIFYTEKAHIYSVVHFCTQPLDINQNTTDEPGQRSSRPMQSLSGVGGRSDLVYQTLYCPAMCVHTNTLNIFIDEGLTVYFTLGINQKTIYFRVL
jgi:hypothetical protein